MSTDRAAADQRHAPSPAVEWRRDRLLRAGFAPGLATELAGDLGTDLHALFELIDHGCPPDLAARILAPLDEPR